MRTKVVSKDVGGGENGAKARATQEYSPTCPKVKMWSKRLQVRRRCWGKGLCLN